MQQIEGGDAVPSNSMSSFTAVDDRFNYKRKGIFWCRMQNESAYIAFTVFAVVIITLFIWGFCIFAEGNAASIIYTLIFDALKLISIIASPLILIGTIRSLRSGDQYSFTADEEKMLIVCPKRDFRADIYYKNVQYVIYEDILHNAKLRGYHVSIICRDTEKYEFHYLFPYKSENRSKDITPFRIIEERAGLLSRPEFIAGQRIDNIGV